MMDGDNYNILVAKGGFIVYIDKNSNRRNAEGDLTDYSSTAVVAPQPRVFTDTSALMNFLHNEFAGA